MRFRLVTYNVHKGIGGVDRLYRPERVVETLRKHTPDIVFLQEVDDGVPRSSHHRQVDWFGQELGLRHRAFQRNVSLREGFYGNAILSRYPLADVEDVDLTVPFKKRRQALVAHCHLWVGKHRRRLLLVNLHLGLAGFERSLQLKRLLQSDTFSHTHQTTASIVAGDFNDVWGNLGSRSLEPAGFRPAMGNIKTFPAALPLRPLDRIYFRGPLRRVRCFASHTQVARQASDHLPLVGEFRLVLE